MSNGLGFRVPKAPPYIFFQLRGMSTPVILNIIVAECVGCMCRIPKYGQKRDNLSMQPLCVKPSGSSCPCHKATKHHAPKPKMRGWERELATAQCMGF